MCLLLQSSLALLRGFVRVTIGNGLNKIKLSSLHGSLQGSPPLSRTHAHIYLHERGGGVGCRTTKSHKVRTGSVYGCFSFFFFLSLALSGGAVCCLPGSLLYLVNTTTQLLAINGGSIPLRRLPLCALTDLATTYPSHLFFFFTFFFLTPCFFMTLRSQLNTPAF